MKTRANPLISNLSYFSLSSILKKSTIMKSLFSLLLVVIIGIGTATFSQTVTIGTQVWMTKNLDVATFRNGDPIPEAKTDEEWESAGELKQPAWCYYDNDPANGAKYGKLYNWFAVNDKRGLAPVGYHVPSDAEWTKLTNFLGGEEVAGTKMKSKSEWKEVGNGTNESGFSGLPSGYRGFSGTFYYVGYFGFWWSSTEYSTYDAWYRHVNYDYGLVYGGFNLKPFGFSVRCISGDQPIEDTTMMEFLPPIITDAETDFLIPIPEQIEDTMMEFSPPIITDAETDFSIPIDEQLETFDSYPDIIEINPTDDGLESPVTFVEEEADFPGGNEAMFNFINEYIDYPREAIDSAIRGRVIVRFVVEKDGRVSNVTVVGPLAGCKACDRAAVNVVEKMPAWIPGKNGGKAVRSWVVLPFKFEAY
jgi:TonB family protein